MPRQGKYVDHPLGRTMAQGIAGTEVETSQRTEPMTLLDIRGYAAAACTTGAYVPQVMKVWQTRSTKDVSLKMFLVLVEGLCLWLAYGIGNHVIPLMLANSITLCLAGVILYVKLRLG